MSSSVKDSLPPKIYFVVTSRDYKVIPDLVVRLLVGKTSFSSVLKKKLMSCSPILKYCTYEEPLWD